MNPGRDAAILIGLIVGLFVLSYILNSVESVENRTLRNTVNLPEYYPENEDTAVLKNEQTEEEKRQAIEEDIEQAKIELLRVEEELEKIKKYGETSPYAGLIKIRKNSGSLRATDPSREYVVLETLRGSNEPITISGWKLQSAISGIELEIPEAVHLVFPGVTGSALPVVVLPLDKIYITTGRSPIGVSFRVNKCSGYYNQFQKFIPSINTKCGDPSDEILNYDRDPYIFIDNTCMDYVDRMPTCKAPISPLPVNLSYTCAEAIIDEINYGACIENHKNDEDFRRPDWRIFLKRDSDVWRSKRELIKLLDESGKTVDYYSY
jgi:hypothetical protein